MIKGIFYKKQTFILPFTKDFFSYILWQTFHFFFLSAMSLSLRQCHQNRNGTAHCRGVQMCHLHHLSDTTEETYYSIYFLKYYTGIIFRTAQPCAFYLL